MTEFTIWLYSLEAWGFYTSPQETRSRGFMPIYCQQHKGRGYQASRNLLHIVSGTTECKEMERKTYLPGSWHLPEIQLYSAVFYFTFLAYLQITWLLRLCNCVNCSSKVLNQEIHSTIFFDTSLFKFSNFICNNVDVGLVIFSLSYLIFFYPLTDLVSQYFLY